VRYDGDVLRHPAQVHRQKDFWKCSISRDTFRSRKIIRTSIFLTKGNRIQARSKACLILPCIFTKKMVTYGKDLRRSHQDRWQYAAS
jgi:hypothetical protein